MTESRERDGRRGTSAPAAVGPLVAGALVAGALDAVGAGVVGLVHPQVAPTSTSTVRIVAYDGALRPGQQLGNVVVCGPQTSVQS